MALGSRVSGQNCVSGAVEGCAALPMGESREAAIGAAI